MSTLEEGPQVDEVRVRVCPTGEQVPADARRAEAPERTVYRNSAMSNESAWLPAGACDPFNLAEEKAFPHHRLTGQYQQLFRLSYTHVLHRHLLHGTNPYRNCTYHSLHYFVHDLSCHLYMKVTSFLAALHIPCLVLSNFNFI